MFGSRGAARNFYLGVVGCWFSLYALSVKVYVGVTAPLLLFPSGIPTKTLYAPLHIPALLILFDFITRTVLGEQYGSLSSSIITIITIIIIITHYW